MSVARRIRKRAQATTLADVAAEAGVSTASVSRALNSPEQVSKQIRARVERAVDRLDWVPHGAAKALASLRTRTVGAITATLGHANVAREIEALQGELMREGYVLLLACSGLDAGNELAQARRLLERGVDGLILHHSASHGPEVWDLLASRNVPTVVTRASEPLERFSTVGYDGYAAFARMTRYLLSLGHRRFGLMMITSPQREAEGLDAPDERVASAHRGIVDTLAEHGLSLDPRHVTNSYFTLAKGRRNLRRILGADNPPTAVIAMNDYLGAGALLEAAALGLRVPHDLSIVGFDDIEIAAEVTPGLTTMRTPDRAMGVATGQCVIAQLDDAESGIKRVELPVELVVRESTGPAPGRGVSVRV